MDRTIKLYEGTVEISFKEESHRYHLLDHENLTKAGTPRKISIPGVTTILGIIDKPQLIPWAVGVAINYVKEHLDKINDKPSEILAEAKKEANRIKEESADLGSDIHLWIERHIKGEKPEMPKDENIKRGALSFLEWENKVKPEYTFSEKIVYSKKYNYVGTVDVGCKIGSKLYTLDLKTGNAIWQTHHAQVAAYQKADEEENGMKYDGRIVLRISKETEEDYLEKMKEKAYFQKDPSKYPYKIFEALYLDEEENNVEEDFQAFLSALNIYNWKK